MKVNILSPQFTIDCFTIGFKFFFFYLFECDYSVTLVYCCCLWEFAQRKLANSSTADVPFSSLDSV